MLRTDKNETIVVSALRAAAPEPEVLKVIGEESRRKRTDIFTPRQIDRIIKAARSKKPKR